MELNRRDVLKGAAAAVTAGGLTALVPAGTAAAATHSLLRLGSHGAEVRALQLRLTHLGYWLGKIDGGYGDLTQQAIVAVQKVAGLQRDGQCGPLTWKLIDAGIRPKARTTKGHAIEINKKTQTLIVVDSGVVRQIYNTSTGSGKRYFQDKKWHVALTPSGTFRVFRQVNDWDTGPLGELYRPKYFNAGIAVHGYASVPSVAASHGCCRVSLRAMHNLWRPNGIPLGTPVIVF